MTKKTNRLISELNLIKEDYNQILFDHNNEIIHYYFDIKNGLITEKNLTTKKIISQFNAFLIFEKTPIRSPDILRSAIKIHHLINYHNSNDYLHFEYKYITKQL